MSFDVQHFQHPTILTKRKVIEQRSSNKSPGGQVTFLPVGQDCYRADVFLFLLLSTKINFSIM